MNFRTLFINMAKIFPHPISMSDLHSMKRRKLTSEEEKKPYAKYFHKRLAEIPAADLEMYSFMLFVRLRVGSSSVAAIGFCKR